MEQLDMFGADPGETRKRLALRTALDGVSDDYQRAFLVAVGRRADRGVPFTSEDVTFDVGLPNAPEQNRNNAIGALMAKAAAAGLIRKTGRMVTAKAVRANNRELREWIGVGGKEV